MDKCDNSFLDNDKTVGLGQTLDYISQQIGRKPSRLEESIIGLLHSNCANRMDHRFTTDENHDLLASETDDQFGIVELTDDYACAFKTEPVYAVSAKDIAGQVAQASGKAYREMSVCGSQPVASLVSISSDIPANASAQVDLQNAIRKISSYSNTYGIPVVGGSAYFNNFGQQSLAANLLTVGLIDKDVRLSSSCLGEGNLVYIVGASENGKQIQENAFAARALYELICDLHDERAIVAIQDIGQGGIAGTCMEMVANGVNGIELKADTLIDTADDFQKLLEYTPGKVMIIIRDEHRKKLENACRKWDKQWQQAGTVIEAHKLSVVYNQANIAEIPAEVVSVFYAGVPEKEIRMSAAATSGSNSVEIPFPEEHKEVAKFLLTCPNLLSQQWIFEQFDSTVGTNTLSTNYISDASVMQIKGARHALAMSLCQNTCDLYKYPEAVRNVIAESLRRVICSGGTPRALTGCLNYSGDPAAMENQLRIINDYIALACKEVGVTSSGINFNHAGITEKPAIDNLSIGTVAFLNDKHQHMTMSFKGKGDMIYMLGKSADNLDSSEYIRNYHNIKDTPPPYIDIEAEAKLLRVAQKVIARKLVKSAHTVSQGGLFMALLESAMVRSFGFDVTVDDEIRKDAFLFGESSSRIVVSVAVNREADFIDFMMEAEVPFLTLGHVTREEIRIDDNSYGFISDYKKAYFR